MSETLEDKLAKIERGEERLRHHFGEAAMADPTLYVADLVIFGALKRTLALADGFRRHIEERNFTCAGALLRLQLDTALRLYGGLLYGDSHAYADAIFKGQPVDKLRDRHGKGMTDRYLCDQLSRDHPWVKTMYDELCDFIHFSNRHIFTAATITDDKERTLSLVIGPKDPPRPDSDYFEIVDGFFQTMRLTATLAGGWHKALHDSDSRVYSCMTGRAANSVTVPTPPSPAAPRAHRASTIGKDCLKAARREKEPPALF